MNFPFFIARRYFIAKKSQHVINFITKIAITGVAVGTMALVIVLSAFNGIENLVLSLFNAFDPELVISINEGKTFDPNTLEFEKIKKLDNIAHFVEIIEENALLKYQEKQYIATIKGVSSPFLSMNRLDTMLVDGEFNLGNSMNPAAVIGQGVAINLGINLLHINVPLQVYVPRRNKKVTFNPEEAFKNSPLFISGVFSIQHDFDSKYIIVPIEFCRELLDYPHQISAVELGIKKGAKIDAVQKQIQEILGNSFSVKNRYQQHDFLYKVMKSEKLAVFLILSFILMIATFNVIGSLTMLIIDKKKDLKILWDMGASTHLIRKIFFIEGMFISLFGAFIGLLGGLIICLIQINFEIITLDGSFVMNAYPIKLKTLDFVCISLTVLSIGAIAAWFPAKLITLKILPSKD